MEEIAALRLVEWIVGRSLAGAPPRDILTGLCERLASAGVPLTRVALGADILHPTIEGQGLRWKRGQAIEHFEYERETTPEREADWTGSPWHFVLTQHLPHMRRRLDGDYRAGEFKMLDELKAGGATDYLTFAISIPDGGALGPARGLISSWVVDRPGGFTDAEVAAIERLARALTLAVNGATSIATGRTLLETYLGADAAAQVLAGNIVRGQAESIRAAVWFSDLADFTKISDGATPEVTLDLLNDYAGCLADSIHAHQGEVLKFAGDAILAIFRDDDRPRACARALDAAHAAAAGTDEIGRVRRADGRVATEFGLALHFGDLLYGNFGSRTRLDFTVLGPTVNEASRIATMCRSLDQRVIASSAFAEAAGNRRAELVSLGRYALRGVGRPQELFTLDPTAQRA